MATEQALIGQTLDEALTQESILTHSGFIVDGVGFAHDATTVQTPSNTVLTRDGQIIPPVFSSSDEMDRVQARLSKKHSDRAWKTVKCGIATALSVAVIGAEPLVGKEVAGAGYVLVGVFAILTYLEFEGTGALSTQIQRLSKLQELVKNSNSKGSNLYSLPDGNSNVRVIMNEAPTS